MRHYQSRTNRNKVRLAVNENYAEKQIAKIEARGELTIKEVPEVDNSLVKVRDHIITSLEFNDMPIVESIVRELIAKFQYTPICNIKGHIIIKEYYKIEDLHKYLIK